VNAIDGAGTVQPEIIAASAVLRRPSAPLPATMRRNGLEGHSPPPPIAYTLCLTPCAPFPAGTVGWSEALSRAKDRMPWSRRDWSISVTDPSTQPTSDETTWATASGTIRKGMQVLAPDGTLLGTVGGLDGEELLLAEHGPGERTSFVAVTQIDGVSEDAVLLSGRGDATFGLGAQP